MPVKLHEALILAAILFILLFCSPPVNAARNDDLSFSKGEVDSLQQLFIRQNKKIKDEASEIDSLRDELDSLKHCIMKNSLRGVATTTCVITCDETGFDCRKHAKEF